jgi:hypothetical protein
MKKNQNHGADECSTEAAASVERAGRKGHYWMGEGDVNFLTVQAAGGVVNGASHAT